MENKIYYRIAKHIENTGAIKIRLPKKYITIRFNTTFPTEYSQEYLKRLYQNKEAKPYIEEFTSDIPLEQIVKTEYYNNLTKLTLLDNIVLVANNATNDNDETKSLSEMSLSELRKLYPNIKSNSKALFLKKIEEQNEQKT